MPLVGGLRDRMVLESIVRNLSAHLTSLGWLATTRQHSPITIIDEYPDETNEDVPINTLAFSYGDVTSDPLELGAFSEEIFSPIFIDFFAESDALGRHVIGDLHTHVKKQGQFTVYDYTQDPVTSEFVVFLVDDSITKRKPGRAVNSWQKNWHVLSFVVYEERSNV